ncbi:MAG: 3-oxoacyl-ACP reductase family protein [Sphingomonadaceae bacterium]
MRFDGKVVLVTGGARGIGKGISLLFGQLGARVAVNYARNDQAAEALAKEMRDVGAEVALFKADVSDYEAAEGTVERVTAHFGALDVLVNNAGINIPPHNILDMSPEVWHRIIATNLTSMYNVTRPAARFMKEHGGGAIINVASNVISTGGGSGPAYAASKAGVQGFTRSLGKDLAPYGIRVNAIAPGVTETEMIAGLPQEVQARLRAPAPVGRIGRPSDVAGLAAFLASEYAAFIAGQTIFVDGGKY